MAYEELQPFMTPFPVADDVFADPVNEHRKVFQPVMSIDASTVDPSWSGRLHFVIPLEPDDGLVGEQSEKHYTDYCVMNWVAFEVRGSRYRFLADFRYFRINSDELRPEDRDYLQSDYDRKEASLEETKGFFEQTGELRTPVNREKSVGWLDCLGGEVGEGNWTAYGLSVKTSSDDEGEFVRPLTMDGRTFRFVGSLTGWNYRDNAPDSVLLFYDPNTSIAALTFDWT